jgi:hypothetical protein
LPLDEFSSVLSASSVVRNFRLRIADFWVNLQSKITNLKSLTTEGTEANYSSSPVSINGLGRRIISCKDAPAATMG